MEIEAVGDVPTITSTMGTTRILMPRPGVFSESRSTPRKNEATHESGGKSFGVVYVNSLAREFFNAAPFPPGAIIVREKLAKVDDAQPQLLAVMIKRARGFNPRANDWEFLMLDGATNKILERQKQGSCLDCHASQKQRDFVYSPGVVNN
jgi:hypothetical protein